MYDYMCGKLVEINAKEAVVDVAGIGYKFFVPVSALVNPLAKSVKIGSPICIYTTLVVRENFHALYGFLEKSERAVFEVLIAISGIGPKTALSLIGHLSPSELTAAIIQHNSAVLSKVPGIGKKTAERLIVELKGKLDKFSYESDQPLSSSQKIQDAINALMHLGYNQNAATEVLKKVADKVPHDCDLSTLITAALKVYK